MPFNIDEFINTLDHVDKAAFADEGERVRARNAANALLSRIESPWDTFMKHVFANPAYTAALKVAHDLKLFQLWTEAGGGVKSSEDLAALTSADPALLERLLRHMTAMQGLEKHPNGGYSMTSFTQALAQRGSSHAIPSLFDMYGPGFFNLPKFLASTNYRNPNDVRHSNWQHLHGDYEDSLQWATKDAETSRMFQAVMEYYSASKPFLTALFPVGELFQKAKKDRAVFVDVGGGAGHDIEKIRAGFNAFPGSCVLLDLPEVIESARVTPPVTKMPYDFFTPQPIKGAGAYFFHVVLHDWPDPEAIEILRNTALAMERGYSRILLQETVVSTAHPHPRATASDLTMMMIASAQERTESMWRDVAAAAGLLVNKIWNGPEDVDGGESVIELSLP